MEDLRGSQPAQVYELVTPFAPEPLKDLAAQRGFPSFSVAESPGVVRTYFRHP